MVFLHLRFPNFPTTESITQLDTIVLVQFVPDPKEPTSSPSFPNCVTEARHGVIDRPYPLVIMHV